MRPNLEETADLVTLTEETFNGKIHFLCSVYCDTSVARAPANIKVVYAKII